jgi:hypothetical protein
VAAKPVARSSVNAALRKWREFMRDLLNNLRPQGAGPGRMRPHDR